MREWTVVRFENVNNCQIVDLVKVCPTCGTENAPTAVRCSCGAFLIGVDLVERAVAAAATVPDTNAASIVDMAHSVPQSHAGVVSVPVQPSASAAPVCAHADCGQPNPAGASICVYCNRPLRTAAVAMPTAPATVAPAGEPEQIAPPADAPARRMLISLPSRLASRFEIREPLKAIGGEADLFIVADRSTGERAVLKLYRHGIEPRTEVLGRVCNAAPDQLVHLLEHGRDEGVPYELLEYCEHGSLRTLFKGKALPPDAVRTLLGELADAIAHLHECGIVHRDLKPENVLIRGLLPLDLVLTDFGISSITDATMHYTSAARTLRYSAPEAGSNWVGRPSDYWALGMMLVEALTGRHPFDGLSEAVVAHWLVTKPIDVAGVADPRWQRLCRGLLTRDPKQRWGAAEIDRWMQGDDAVPVASEQAAPVLGEVPPYRVGDTECRTPRELAVALASHWATGVKDLKRGMLRAWLQNDLRDQNLARAAADAEEAIDQSDDERLLRLLRRLDPSLPPVFKGYDVTESGLAALVRTAMESENEARQTVFEILERGLLEAFAVDALHDAMERFDRARADFEQAIAKAVQAGAPRSVAPEGREWQLRMLLFVLEPPKDLLQSLRASAFRVGSRAARRCPWYVALGNIESATPALLAAMILLGPPAAQAGMAIERETARWALQDLSDRLDAHPQLVKSHGSMRDQLVRTIEGSQDEAELLAACDEVGKLDAALEQAIETLFCSEIFDVWPVRDPERIQAIRGRISEWAAWRAGEEWRPLGDAVELLDVLDRRSYRVELGTQFETRRVAYKYTAPDVARMPPRARATLDDVWSCRMPALPVFGTDLKMDRPQDVQCPACGACGRVALQEAWGSTSYPFSTTFACHDKAGVQCQTRMGRASDHLGVPGAPEFIGEFIDAHASIDPSPERTLEFETARISPAWVARIEPTVSAKCMEMMAAADADLRSGERITKQRLRISWTGVSEVRYRYHGQDYVIWIPERVDVTPIALEHPLPSQDSTVPVAEAPQDPEPQPLQGQPVETKVSAASEPDTVREMPVHTERARRGSGWIRSAGLWLALFTILACIAMWIVNWKP